MKLSDNTFQQIYPKNLVLFKKNISIVANKLCTKYQFKKLRRVVGNREVIKESEIREYFQIEIKSIYEKFNSYLSAKSNIKGKI